MLIRIDTPDGPMTVHLNMGTKARVVPGPERHSWEPKNIGWGQTAKCTKCGCIKHRMKTQPEWCERYQPAGTTDMLAERPACGKPNPQLTLL